jgi:hypothetical protein
MMHMEVNGGIAKGATGVQRNNAASAAYNAAASAAVQVKRSSRGALRRVTALGALALGLAGGWGTALGGGLTGP